MVLSAYRRDQLAANLRALRLGKPVDTVQIERALAAILEALLDEAGKGPLGSESAALGLRGSDLGR
jgi:hypothetical protein